MNLKRVITPRRAAEVRAALQMGVGAMASFYLATWIGLPYPYWSIISAIVIIQASVGGDVLTVARDRALGTVTGAVVGAVIAFIRPPGVESMAVALALASGMLAFFGAGRSWLKIAPVTATIVIAGGSGAEGPASLALERVMEIVVGCAVGVIAILALFPRHARQAFKMQAREAAAETAVLLALVSSGDPSRTTEIATRHTDLKQRLDKLGQSAKNVVDLTSAGQKEAGDRAALARTFWRVRSDIVILGRGFQAEDAVVRLKPWANDVGRAVRNLENLSAGRDVEPLGPVDPTLALSIAVEGDDIAQGAAAIGVSHLHRDLDDLAARFRDLHLA